MQLHVAQHGTTLSRAYPTAHPIDIAALLRATVETGACDQPQEKVPLQGNLDATRFGLAQKHRPAVTAMVPPHRIAASSAVLLVSLHAQLLVQPALLLLCAGGTNHTWHTAQQLALAPCLRCRCCCSWAGELAAPPWWLECGEDWEIGNEEQRKCGTEE